jgi:hypothetical protein
MLDNATWGPRLSPSQLRPGSSYFMLLDKGVELRFADQRGPYSIRIDVIDDGGCLVEETRVVRVSGRSDCRNCHMPLGRGWQIFDDTHPSFVIFRRRPPWMRRHQELAVGHGAVICQAARRLSIAAQTNVRAI